MFGRMQTKEGVKSRCVHSPHGELWSGFLKLWEHALEKVRRSPLQVTQNATVIAWGVQPGTGYVCV